MAVKDYIEERAVEIAGYIVETKATVRQAAKKFGISKSPPWFFLFYYPNEPFYIVTSICTVLLLIPNFFAVCRTVAFVSIM